MANHMGNSGSVEIGANVVAEVVGWTLNTSAVTADDSVQGDNDTTHKIGMKSWSGSVNGFWDETDSTGQQVMKAGDSVDLHLMPDGATTGDIDFNGTATIESVEISLAKDSIVPISFTFKGNGALTETTLA